MTAEFPGCYVIDLRRYAPVYDADFCSVQGILSPDITTDGTDFRIAVTCVAAGF